MRIAILVEGKTEKAFKPYLVAYLQTQLAGKMPKLDIVPHDGRIPTGDKLKRVVENLLSIRKQPADAVIALTDVYTRSKPPEFPTAADAKRKMSQWVGPEPRFYPHVALHRLRGMAAAILEENTEAHRKQSQISGTQS